MERGQELLIEEETSSQDLHGEGHLHFVNRDSKDTSDAFDLQNHL